LDESFSSPILLESKASIFENLIYNNIVIFKFIFKILPNSGKKAQKFTYNAGIILNAFGPLKNMLEQFSNP